MSDEPDAQSADEGTERRKVFNLDDLEREPTGDPLIDRGLELTIEELKEALDNPEHPEHEAAKAANAHMSKQFSDFANNLYGDQFRRIGENLAAALKPNLGNLFGSPKVGSLRASAEPVLPPIRRELVKTPDTDEWQLDETPQQTLEALVEVSERMSEMVRVSAEHRDVAVRQMQHSEAEAESARESERRMLRLTWGAVIGTWVAVIGTWVAVALALS